MITTCTACKLTYDDADNSTICPHRLIMPREDLERKKLAIELIGKTVRFAHEDIPRRVQSISFDGMVSIEGFGGEFAPHLFKVVE